LIEVIGEVDGALIDPAVLALGLTLSSAQILLPSITIQIG
jgi:hypothetical protein